MLIPRAPVSPLVFTGHFGVETFTFDGTVEGFIAAAFKAGLKVHKPHGTSVYLDTPTPYYSLISVFWNEWKEAYSASAVVSMEPLSVILDKIRIDHETSAARSV